MGKRILIIEDEPLIGIDLAFACEDAGLEAEAAQSCRQALAALDAKLFDGAIVDVNLGNGETCEAVAIALRDRAIPFVLNTGDLDRAGEYLRGIGAPIVAKPNAAGAVVTRLIEHAGWV